jgi:pimeloyl-[acyl-carrier protein] methyl ester esterase
MMDHPAPVLCFVGGWGSTEEVWRATLRRVQDPHLLTTADVGHHASQFSCDEDETVAVGEAYFLSWMDCLRDWPGVLERLRALPGRCVLVGWSLGGLLALRAALELEPQKSPELPAKIAALVLVSATACMCAAEGYPGADPRMLAAMRTRMNRNAGAVIEEFAAQCAAPDGDEETRLSWLRQASGFSAPEMQAGLDCLAALDLRERLEGVGARCRILHGECDRIVPVGSARFLAGRIRGAELEVLAGRGHALPFTAPMEIARAIASVLR